MSDFQLNYEDLLTGDPIPMAGVGHLRSPQLREMNPTSGIGWTTYQAYIYYLKMGRKELLQLFPAEYRDQIPNSDLYDIIISFDELRTVFQDALNFFMSELIMYDPSLQQFITVQINADGTEQYVGAITRDNFDDVRLMILTLNYIPTSRTDIQTKFSSKHAERAWRRIQEYMQNSTANESKDEALEIGNLISKLCAIHPSYTYLNVFDLTVFQFYDAFFQCSYLRQISFTEAIVSNHGSDKFKYDDWLKPVKNY